MKTTIFSILTMFCVSFNVNAQQHDEIDPNTLEIAFNDDTIGMNYIDSSGLVIIHDETLTDDTLDAEQIKQLVEQTNEIIAENVQHKWIRTIMSILFIVFVLMSVRNRKKSKNG